MEVLANRAHWHRSEAAVITRDPPANLNNSSIHISHAWNRVCIKLSRQIGQPTPYGSLASAVVVTNGFPPTSACCDTANTPHGMSRIEPAAGLAGAVKRGPLVPLTGNAGRPLSENRTSSGSTGGRQPSWDC